MLAGAPSPEGGELLQARDQAGAGEARGLEVPEGTLKVPWGRAMSGLGGLGCRSEKEVGPALQRKRQQVLPGQRSEVQFTQSCPTLCEPMDCSPPGSSVCGDSPGQDTGVGCHFLLQGFQGRAECKSRCWALGHWEGIEGK